MIFSNSSSSSSEAAGDRRQAAGGRPLAASRKRQAAGRIARIGQAHRTTCVRLVVDDTVESKILQWQQIRLADGASANPQLTLSDFATLAL